MEQSSNESSVLSQEANTGTEITSPAPSPEIKGTPSTQPQGTSPTLEIKGATTEEASETPEIPAYQPNWKFKVSGEEKEMDEWIRPAIKDAETEKKLRKLYEDAYGLEPVKASREKIQQEHQELKQNYQSLHSSVEEAMTYKHQGNLGMFFQKTGVSDDQIAKYMLEKINRSNLPPEQQQVYNELDAKRNQELQLARQLEESDTRYREIASKAKEWEVDQWLAKPEVSSIVERYDGLNGKGSFKNYVAEVGEYLFHKNSGQDVAAEIAVNTVLQRLGNAYRGQQASSPGSTESATPTKELPVIPNVSGKNVSPTQKSVRSIDDLRKLSQEARGA